MIARAGEGIARAFQGGWRARYAGLSSSLCTNTTQVLPARQSILSGMTRPKSFRRADLARPAEGAVCSSYSIIYCSQFPSPDTFDRKRSSVPAISGDGELSALPEGLISLQAILGQCAASKSAPQSVTHGISATSHCVAIPDRVGAMF